MTRIASRQVVAMAAEWVGALGVAAAIVAWALLEPRRPARCPQGPPMRMPLVRISGDYEPAEVHVHAGEPVRLIFRREETASCSERVVFPDFGISVMLPPFENVEIDLPASEPGEHEFTCEMQMLRGKVVVDRRPEDNPTRSRHPGKPAAPTADFPARAAAENGRRAGIARVRWQQSRTHPKARSNERRRLRPLGAQRNGLGRPRVARNQWPPPREDRGVAVVFGEQWDAYPATTPRFSPRLSRRPRRLPQTRSTGPAPVASTLLASSQAH